MSNYGPTSQANTGDFERVCRGCGATFRTDNPDQQYHNNQCKRQAQNARYYARHRAKIRKRALTHYHETK